MLVDLQNWIHRLEVGPWFRFVRIGLAVLAVLALILGYNARSFRNMATQEAMDAAQVGHNLAEGNGYSTLFVRPVSIYLVKQRNEQKHGTVPIQGADYARLKTPHPDLANAPVYPCVLAGLMKVLPFRYAVDNTHIFWSVPSPRPGVPRAFWRYEPDFLIAVFNEFVFFGIIVLVFFLARRLFDQTVAWMSAALLLGSEMLWRFSVSGLPTMLLLLIFTGLVWCLVLIESESREPKHGAKALFLWSAGAGLLLGLGTLTRYGFGVVFVPVTGFLLLVGGARRGPLTATTLLVAALVVTPWLIRNLSLSGLPFGTATYAILEGSPMFPENQLARSLAPDFSRVSLSPLVHKLMNNGRSILQNDVPKLGGSWVTCFFLVGLMLGFRSLALRRLRYFLVASLAMFGLAQALGRTELSEASPEINSENLVVLVLPFVLAYGVSFFLILLGQMNLVVSQLRYVVIGIFVLLVCWPMAATFLPPKPVPVVYPPYFPPAIQQTANWMRDNELMMSDIPWAVAWYGNRQCIWLTLNAESEFFAVNDVLKPVRALYLTPETMDSRFLSQWVRAGEHSWARFILDSMLRNRIDERFPLRISPSGFLPEQLFLTDWERWKKDAIPAQPTPGNEADSKK